MEYTLNKITVRASIQFVHMTYGNIATLVKFVAFFRVDVPNHIF